MKSGLFGIEHSNRAPSDHWGKNCFNSSFPTALACYMMSKNIKAIYARLDKNLNVVCDEISIAELFHCKSNDPKSLEFDFEVPFDPYSHYVYDGESIDGIDLVVKDLDGNPLIPLEVKLTVFPDNSTCEKDKKEWGSELVIRSATTSYCAFGMFDSIKNDAKNARNFLEHPCASIGSWTNEYEMTHKTQALKEGLDAFEKEYWNYQKPLVIQTLWKTKGKSPLLADDAFDIIVWSDFAFSRLFIDDVKPTSKMTRQMRATAKLALALWELCKSEKIHLTDIYRQMTFSNLTDREIAPSGKKWRRYINTDRLNDFSLPKEVVYEVIEKDCIERLSPERRFDQTLYFTMRNKN